MTDTDKTPEQALPTDVALLQSMTPAQIFAPGKLNDVLKAIEEEARKEAKAADATTSSGRERLRANAYKVVRSKTALDKMGLQLTETWRKSVATVNAERKALVERLGTLEDEVRKPLTAFEEREKARVLAHENMLADMNALTVLFPGKDAVPTAAEVLVNLEKARKLGEGRDWQEFADRAADTKARAIDVLTGMHARAVTIEAEAKELAELRAMRIRVEAEKAAADAAREIEERRKAEEARIAAAAEAARVKAETEAKEREAAIEAARLKAEEQAKEREAALVREAAEREAKLQREAAEQQAETERQAAAYAAHLAKLEQERKEREAEQVRQEAARVEAARVMEEARKREQEAKIAEAVEKANRDAAETARRLRELAEADAEKKAANKANRNKVHNVTALKMMEVSSIGQLPAHKVVEAIANGEFPHLTISYG